MNEELSAYAKKKRSKRVQRYVALFLLLAVLLGVASYVLSEKFFVVRKIQIQETDLYSADALLEACGISIGSPLITVSKKEVSSALEEKFPYLVHVKVSFDLPNVVCVSFTEDFGDLGLQLGTELFSIDRELNVLAKESPDSTIPRIQLITGDVLRCVVGEKLAFFDENTERMLLDLVIALEEEGFLSEVNRIDIRDKFDICVRYLDRFDLYLGENQDLKYKFAMVKGVIADLPADAKGKIDITDPNTAYVQLNESDR